jgi:hypothetical protein
MLRPAGPLTLVLLLAAACTAPPAGGPAGAAAGTNAVRTVPGLAPLAGRVHSVNLGLKFVVIDYSLGGVPKDGDRVSVWRQGQRVAELRVSGAPRHGFVAADILSGSVQRGDAVRLE